MYTDAEIIHCVPASSGRQPVLMSHLMHAYSGGNYNWGTHRQQVALSARILGECQRERINLHCKISVDIKVTARRMGQA